MKKTILLLFCFMVCSTASADAISMRDYIKLRDGMTEAEVLYLLGPYDHETIRSDGFDGVIERTWFYIPASTGSQKWITELLFDARGILRQRDRYRVR